MGSNKLKNEIFHSVTLIKVTFQIDEIGNALTITGTGFWIKTSYNEDILVTNKHNLVPGIRGTKYKEYKIIKIEILIHEKQSEAFSDHAQFFSADLNYLEGKVHKTADAAILRIPKLKNYDIKFQAVSAQESTIADSNYLKIDACPLDPVAFIGYPQTWYDEVRQLPIARIAYIANESSKPYNNSAIKTSDVTLVSGLSFGGSSGSPVILMPKGIGIPTSFSPHVIPKIIGIMSGHARDILLDPRIPENSSPLLSAYSGLSYYTRSTSILELLQNKNCDELSPYIHILFEEVI